MFEVRNFHSIKNVEEFFEIAKFAFGIPFEGTEIHKDYLFRLNDTEKGFYGVFDGEKMTAGEFIGDYTMRLRRSMVKMGGIGFVCSLPNYRGKGTIRAMLTRTIEIMKEKGCPISVLYPFNIDFYRKYGWEVFDRKKYTSISTEVLNLPQQSEGTRIATMNLPDRESMDFYNDYARTHYNFELRKISDWEMISKILNAGEIDKKFVKFTEGSKIIGIMTYVFSFREGKNKLTVTTMVYENEKAKVEILRFLKNLSHQLKSVEIRTPLDFVLWPYLSDRPEETRVVESSMIRITDIRLLEGLDVGSDDFRIKVDITDRQAPWNDGIFELRGSDGILHVSEAVCADVKCGIGTLSSIIAGRTNFNEAISFGMAEKLDGYDGSDLPKVLNFMPAAF